VASAAADVAAIADALGIDDFVTHGASGGGPHALACAALLGDRVPAAAILAGVAPWEADGLDWLDGMGEENHEEFGKALEGEDALRVYLEAQAEDLRRAEPDDLLRLLETLLGAEDRAVLTGAFARFMLQNDLHALEPGVDGWIDDDLAFARPWGFDLDAIDRPVLLVHGDDDRFVPISHGRWLAARIPNVEARIDAGDGHLTLFERRMREVNEWLLSRS
jgi:pimeloyl-ACP methyl ester carboxylesterase